MRLLSLAIVAVSVALAACAGRQRTAPRVAEPPTPQSSPEDAFVTALLGEIDASASADCSVEYQGSGGGDGSGLIVFRGAERHLPPRPPGPPAQITSHSSLRTERYRTPEDVEAAVAEQRAAFERCMHEPPEDPRTRKGLLLRAEGCRVHLFPYAPFAHYAEQFSIVRADSSGDRFYVPQECTDALSRLEARLTPYPSSR